MSDRDDTPAISRTATRDRVHQLQLRHALSEQELSGQVADIEREFARLEVLLKRIIGGAFALALAAAGALGGSISMMQRSRDAAVARDERLRLLEQQLSRLEGYVFERATTRTKDAPP